MFSFQPELSIDDVHYVEVDQTVDQLGEGAFGKVISGSYKEKYVAIKLFKLNADKGLIQK